MAIQSKPDAWAWPHTGPAPLNTHTTYPGSDYGRAIATAHDDATRAGMTNYWHGLWVSLATASNPADLKLCWEYCYRVSDRKSELFSRLETLKERRKQELTKR